LLCDVTEQIFPTFQNSVSQSGWNRIFGTDFEGQMGEKNKGDDWGGERTQRGRKLSITNRSLS